MRRAPTCTASTDVGNAGRRSALGGCKLNQSRELNMPVLIVPLLVGIPVVLGGGYVIYKIIGG